MFQELTLPQNQLSVRRLECPRRRHLAVFLRPDRCREQPVQHRRMGVELRMMLATPQLAHLEGPVQARRLGMEHRVTPATLRRTRPRVKLPYQVSQARPQMEHP